jgi:hypothetical protein
MVDRDGQLDDPKMTRTLSHVLFASGTSEVAIDGTQMGVVETLLSRSKTCIILHIYDVRSMLQVTSFAEYIELH